MRLNVWANDSDHRGRRIRQGRERQAKCDDAVRPPIETEGCAGGTQQASASRPSLPEDFLHNRWRHHDESSGPVGVERDPYAVPWC